MQGLDLHLSHGEAMKHSTTLLSLARDKIHPPYYYAHLETKQELWRKLSQKLQKIVNFCICFWTYFRIARLFLYCTIFNISKYFKWATYFNSRSLAYFHWNQPRKYISSIKKNLTFEQFLNVCTGPQLYYSKPYKIAVR